MVWPDLDGVAYCPVCLEMWMKCQGTPRSPKRPGIPGVCRVFKKGQEGPRKKISMFPEIIREAFSSHYVCQLLASLRQAGKLEASVGLGQRARVEVVLHFHR